MSTGLTSSDDPRSSDGFSWSADRRPRVSVLIALALGLVGLTGLVVALWAGPGEAVPPSEASVVAGHGQESPEVLRLHDARRDAGVPLDRPNDWERRRPRSALADFTQPLGSALELPVVEDGPVPVALSYDALGIDAAPIDAVGVLDDGQMEIPGSDAVGWYRFGPRPGAPGSAVLAAHIAFGGRPGVFRDLVDAEVGHRFTVRFDDGSEAIYEIVEQGQYDKEELPFDRIFAKDGPPVITLISCGGAFQPALRSYEDNLVAYAVPVSVLE